jgi:elongation factor Ts
MPAVTQEMVKDLREKTGAGIMDCKRALSEAGGDMDKALDILRQKGQAIAAKKAVRETREGVIGSYIHAGGRIGVLAEINCETDFVARNPEFQELVKDITMQIAWSNPSYLRREEVPPSVLEKEREIYRAQARETGKSEHVIEKIVDGKIEKFLNDSCLLEQPFIKDSSVTLNDLIRRKIAKTGENISVKRFVRYQLGE